ncbi:MAG TPA: hypothetical protein VG010_03880 [Solirubrobacteraceae bacterium]|nr:hypothetical protein [Solirubrobacteraceae bacterium]
MSATGARPASWAAHPLVLSRRVRELGVLGLSIAVPLVLGLAISVQFTEPSVVVLIAVALGAAGVIALLLSPRYEVTLAIVALYLGLLEGTAKLRFGSHELGSALRDLLIFAVSLGAFLRLIVSRQRLRLPPLSGWVIAFVALVLVEAFNPMTVNLTKALGGFRQQLEWIPFFFFGYAIMRSKDRFRKLFLVLGVVALANGLMSTYQTRLSPAQLASWGPGYRELVFGSNGLGGRTFRSEGSSHVRPPGLGTDAGFAGGVGVVALAPTLALLAVGGMRRRWPLALLCLGAMLAVATGLGRLQVVGAVFAVLLFAVLSFTAGRSVTKPLAAVLGILVLAVPTAAIVTSIAGSGTFGRYASLDPTKLSSNKDNKISSLRLIPGELEAAPLGVGLASVGAAGGFGGKNTNLVNGHGVSAETQYNFISDELGLPGLLLWVALTIELLVLGLRGLPRIADVELRIYLSAVFATFIAFTFIGLSGPTMSSAAFGPFFWFTVGIAAYWFAGPGRVSRSDGSPAPGSS